MTLDRTNIIGKTFLLTVLLSGILQASVFNDAAFWVREFRDADADGMIENANDVADARNINGESTVTLYGTPEGRIVSIEDIVNPYTGKTIVSAPCCYFPQSIYVSPKDNTTIVHTYLYAGQARLPIIYTPQNGMDSGQRRVLPRCDAQPPQPHRTGHTDRKLQKYIWRRDNDRLHLIGRYRIFRP